MFEIQSPLDLKLLPVGNIVIEKLPTSPTGEEARIYYDTGTNQMYFYNGSTWVSMGGVSDSFIKAIIFG